MKLAREFRRPDWRAMLAGMSSSEYSDWIRFYQTHYFQDAQWDAHFSSLLYCVLSLAVRDPELSPQQFSLFAGTLSPHRETALDDETLMAKAEGISGGIRYGPDHGQ